MASDDKSYIINLKEKYQKSLDKRRIIYEKLTNSKLEKDSEIYKTLKFEAEKADNIVEKELNKIHSFYSSSYDNREEIKKEKTPNKNIFEEDIYDNHYNIDEYYDDDDYNFQIALNTSLYET